MKTDVLVVGGGSAGIAAAVTAARDGAHVLLIERSGTLGGMGTSSLVHTFCGLYQPDTDHPQIANPGLSEEIESRMRSATGIAPQKAGRVWYLPQHPVDFAQLADDLTRESGVHILFHAELIALQQGWRAELTSRGTRIHIAASAVIDASGDAVCAALLRQPDERHPSTRLQRPAYVCGIQGISGELNGLELAGRLVEGARAGHLPRAALGMHFRASGRPREIFGTLDLSGEELGHYDPLDPACLTALEITGRRTSAAIVTYLRQRHPGWQNAYISHWPARAGVRESRTWRGQAQLTGHEILAATRHPDDIALAAWPMELRETNRGPKLRFPENGGIAGIPAGALRAADFPGMFAAGRCISCDHQAQASIRVMGTCFATGEAAGHMATHHR